MSFDFDLDLSADDDVGFVHVVRDIVRGVVAAARPAQLFLVKVDNWFGAQWLGFSHKALGAVAVWQNELRVPPFVPHRIISASYLQLDRNGRRLAVEATPFLLHGDRPSHENNGRALSRLCPRAALFWWSGATRENGQGSLLAYVPASDGHYGFYVGMKRAPAWQFDRLCNVSRAELQHYAASSHAHQ